MGFRSRKSIVILGGWSAFEDVDELDESGLSRSKRFDPHSTKLPTPDNYELDVLLKAGVPLQQTRTKVLSPDAVLLADALASMDDKEFEELNENNKQ